MSEGEWKLSTKNIVKFYSLEQAGKLAGSGEGGEVGWL
jgi:hypothetical protein